MSLVSMQRWQAVCEAVGLATGANQFRAVVRGWRSLGRHYHTTAHLEACLREFDAVRDLAAHPGEVELALWFHDAVYRTWRSDNEARSADWAARVMNASGADASAIDRVCASILATRHVGAELGGDAALVVDIDLSILGQPPGTYREFEKNVRREYWWVPWRKYVAGRSAILNSFLSRAEIYRFPMFRDRYEQMARENMSGAIRDLKA
jgi:predicted metal-dependent HD superfamily phosphohydrolase